MVYLQASIKLKPGKLQDFVVMLNELAPVLAKRGMKLLGSYGNVVGRLNTVVDFWELPDANALQAALSDPELQKLAPRISDIIEDETQVLLTKINNPSLMPTAIEEILRWSSPITHIARFATRDTELAGKTIREGDLVALWLPSGIETRRLSTIRIALTLNALPTNMSPSAGASISAPARIWRGSNFVS
jgi:hypothetical protein